MISYDSIAWYCMLLRYWLRRAGCVSQDAYILHIYIYILCNLSIWLFITLHNCCIGWAGMQEMNSTVQHCIWADLTRWEGLGTLKCSSLFYVTNLPLLQIKTHHVLWYEFIGLNPSHQIYSCMVPGFERDVSHGSWLWERCIKFGLWLWDFTSSWGSTTAFFLSEWLQRVENAFQQR